MALFFECRESRAPNLLDTADIVRDAILRQLEGTVVTSVLLGRQELLLGEGKGLRQAGICSLD
jgi:hypothetical protein